MIGASQFWLFARDSTNQIWFIDGLKKIIPSLPLSSKPVTC